VTSRAITIGTWPAESRGYQCPAPLRHFQNSLSRFSLFYNAFLPTDHKNLQQHHCSLLANVLMMEAAVTETSTKMSFTSIALAVIFIIRLFSPTFRVPKNLTFLKLSVIHSNMIVYLLLRAWASEGGGRGSKAALGFWNFQQKRLYFEWEKNKFHHFWPPLEKFWKKTLLTPP